MENASLRELANAYARGKMTRADYLQSRSLLINNIVKGEGEAVPPPPPETAEAKPARTHPQTERLRLDALAGIAVILAMSLAFYWYLHSDGTPEHPAVASIPLPAQPGVTLLESFLAANDWDETSERQLLGRWQGLTEAAQTQARGSLPYRQLQDALYQAVLEEQALMELGDDANDAKPLQNLLSLAQSLGLTDSRYTKAQSRLESWLASHSANPNADDSSMAEEAGVASTPPSQEPAPPITDSTPESSPPAPEHHARPETPATPASPPAKVSASGPGKQIAEQKPRPVTMAAPAAPATTAVPTPVSAPVPTAVKTLRQAQPSTVAADENSSRKTRHRGCIADLARSRKPYCRDTIEGDGKAPLMVVLPAGTFMMGGDGPSERPRHEVQLPSAFAIAMYEITQQEFARFCADDKMVCPTQPWSDQNLPVVNISWHDAQAYTDWLSRRTGRRYRLPNEAEWEYAARAGAKGRYPRGDELLPTQARFSYQAVMDKPLPKDDRSVNRNRFRLYHMLGNVREWVIDDWQDSYQGAAHTGQAHTGTDKRRVVRGGAYHDRADAVSLSSRMPQVADQHDPYTGFRIVQTFSNTNTPVLRMQGQAWLASQGQGMLTLQLFAGRNIQAMQVLMTKHRDLEIHVLPADTTAVSYRAVYGIFPSRKAARAAFAQLPEDISSLAGKPIIKTIAELKVKR